MPLCKLECTPNWFRLAGTLLLHPTVTLLYVVQPACQIYSWIEIDFIHNMRSMKNVDISAINTLGSHVRIILAYVLHTKTQSSTIIFCVAYTCILNSVPTQYQFQFEVVT